MLFGESMTDFQLGEAFAKRLDAADPLRAYRERFEIPVGPDGRPVIYFCGNSLGLMPKAAREAVDQELDDWARLAVDAHLSAKTPWYSYHEIFRETGARLVGAKPGEVVMMNGLTLNLHLMMVSFFRPTAERCKILIDVPTFPSDLYAIKTHLTHHGLDPADALLVVGPREGEHTVRTEDIEDRIERDGDRIALVLIAGINFFTGQAQDMPRIAAAARRRGCNIGFDLAHAAGNIPLSLHDWDADFAVWCSYKYLNSGPGAVAGCFVHECHARRTDLPRFAGWWGNDPATRFEMLRRLEFVPRDGADGWQISNPPILTMAPLRASLTMFDEIGMAALRAKSERLTGYLQFLIDDIQSAGGSKESCGTGFQPGRYEVITPRDPAARGCQLSILVHDRPKELFESLRAAHIIGDFREPNVIRIAPTPLYNTFQEVWRFSRILGGEQV